MGNVQLGATKYINKALRTFLNLPPASLPPPSTLCELVYNKEKEEYEGKAVVENADHQRILLIFLFISFSRSNIQSINLRHSITFHYYTLNYLYIIPAHDASHATTQSNAHLRSVTHNCAARTHMRRHITQAQG